MPATAPRPVAIPIEGMTCGHCVATVRKALEAVPGVRSASVDLASGRAEVMGDGPALDRAPLEAAIEAAGYRVPGRAAAPRLVTIGMAPATPAVAAAEEWNLAIGGMHCASCVSRVEGALLAIPGVDRARVNLATERAAVRVDPSRASESAIVAAIRAAGYAARRAELVVGEGADVAPPRSARRPWPAIGGGDSSSGSRLTIPLVILGYAPLLSVSDRPPTRRGSGG